MSEKTVFQMWKAFERRAPMELPPVTREALRRMFYAGAHIMFHLAEDVCTQRPDESEVERERRVDREMNVLHRELSAFETDMRFG